MVAFFLGFGQFWVAMSPLIDFGSRVMEPNGGLKGSGMVRFWACKRINNKSGTQVAGPYKLICKGVEACSSPWVRPL